MNPSSCGRPPWTRRCRPLQGADRRRHRGRPRVHHADGRRGGAAPRLHRDECAEGGEYRRVASQITIAIRTLLGGLSLSNLDLARHSLHPGSRSWRAFARADALSWRAIPRPVRGTRCRHGILLALAARCRARSTLRSCSSTRPGPKEPGITPRRSWSPRVLPVQPEQSFQPQADSTPGADDRPACGAGPCGLWCCLAQGPCPWRSPSVRLSGVVARKLYALRGERANFRLNPAARRGVRRGFWARPCSAWAGNAQALVREPVRQRDRLAFLLVQVTLGLRPQLSAEVRESAQAAYANTTLSQGRLPGCVAAASTRSCSRSACTSTRI